MRVSRGSRWCLLNGLMGLVQSRPLAKLVYSNHTVVVSINGRQQLLKLCHTQPHVQGLDCIAQLVKVNRPRPITVHRSKERPQVSTLSSVQDAMCVHSIPQDLHQCRLNLIRHGTNVGRFL